MHIKAVFIDLDGTLLDSLPALYKVYHRFLGTYGYQGSQEEFEALNGPTLPEIIDILRKKYQLPLTNQQLFAEYMSLLHQYYAKEVKLLPGSKDFLIWAHQKGLQLALVTSCPRTLSHDFVHGHQLEAYFGKIISAEDVPYGKPNSAIYQKALKVIDKLAPEVIAIEDSDNGVEAALGANITTIQITTRKNDPFQKKPQIVVKNWHEILTLFLTRF